MFTWSELIELHQHLNPHDSLDQVGLGEEMAFFRSSVYFIMFRLFNEFSLVVVYLCSRSGVYSVSFCLSVCLPYRVRHAREFLVAHTNENTKASDLTVHMLEKIKWQSLNQGMLIEVSLIRFAQFGLMKMYTWHLKLPSCRPCLFESSF